MSNIQIGDIVKSPYEDMMCRAQILDKKDQANYCISFIDFGNKENVHISQIFEISDELKKVNIRLLFCFLTLIINKIICMLMLIICILVLILIYYGFF